MKRVLLAGVLGGVAAFAWGAISWIVLPWHLMSMKALRDDAPVVSALREQASEAGMYVVPGSPELRGDDSPAAREAYERDSKSSPFAIVVYDPAGIEGSPRPFAVGLLLCIAYASVAAGLLSLAAPSLRGYGGRVVFVATLGLLAALMGPIVEWNWLQYPLCPSLVDAADVIVTFVVIGLVAAAIVKVPRAA